MITNQIGQEFPAYSMLEKKDYIHTQMRADNELARTKGGSPLSSSRISLTRPKTQGACNIIPK